ncbi:helix-turn-helix domain-containing protein [Enterococcus sp. 22-H-5-01]|uniref:helix-turn-helix domain-containing protein n=1 Tax=Enterococcus sp. 22-H-5-01 TaxID=3418555 RepID=UPI003D070D4B
MRLLLLTKVPLYEESFELQLKQLGNEVYCSSNVIEMIKKEVITPQFINQFEGIIFSETLYDNETNELVQQLPQGDFKLFRRAIETTFGEEANNIFDACIPIGASLERLRELLVVAEIAHLSFQEADRTQQISVKQKLSNMNLKLKQKEIVYYLIKSGDRTVPREEISRQIWEKAPTKSVLASLSKVVSKVNEKLQGEFGDEAIQTVWGQGYRLNKKIFDYIENDVIELESAGIQ